MEKVHALKTLPQFFNVLGIQKLFEVRKNDRDFKIGDTLWLQEWSEENGYTGKDKKYRIIYILKGGQFGIDPEYCVLGLDPSMRTHSDGNANLHQIKEKEIKVNEIKEKKTHINTWRDDFDIYQKECGEAFDTQVTDLIWIEEKKRYYPYTSIRKSLEKMYNEYWGTEAGWKKKKEKKSKEIDWLRTIENGLSMIGNRVRIPKGTPDFEQEEIEKSKHAKSSPV
jgi:Domain of unknown function (DUF3850)